MPPPAPSPSWVDDVRAFCSNQSDRWLASLVDRVDRALPAQFEQGSAQAEGVNLQRPFAGGEGIMELQLRIVVQRNGKPVQLSAYAPLAWGKCAVDEMEVIEGYNRFDPPLRFNAPD